MGHADLHSRRHDRRPQVGRGAGIGAGLLLFILHAATILAQGPLPAPSGLAMLLEETNGDFLLNNARIWWQRVEGATAYRIELTREGDATALSTFNVNQPATAWVEARPSLGGSLTVYDYDPLVAQVQARNAEGEFGEGSSVTATLAVRVSPRGDANGDRSVDLGDALAVLFYLFGRQIELSPYAVQYAADADGNRTVGIEDAIFLLNALFMEGPLPQDAPPRATVNHMLIGAFHGNTAIQPMYSSMVDVKAFELWQKRKQAVVNLFSPWTQTGADQLFVTQLPNIWANGNVPMITWEPHPGGEESSVEVRAAGGEFDAYFRSWAGRLKTWLKGPDKKFGDEAGGPELDPTASADNRRCYIRLGHEMNGWWTPWNAATGNNSPNDFKAMWVRVHDILVAENRLDSNHVQWVWCVNNVDSDSETGTVKFPAERYYPGDDYVDWVALDGYNWGLSQTWSNLWMLPPVVFNDSFASNRMLTRLAALAPTKPVAVAEYGSTSIDSRTQPLSNVVRKNQWLTATLSYLLTSKVRMAVYFSLDKETDWAIYSGALGRGDETVAGRKGYSAYRQAVGSSLFISPAGGNPRILTDEEFRGEW